jgi:hypothetical protein
MYAPGNIMGSCFYKILTITARLRFGGAPKSSQDTNNMRGFLLLSLLPSALAAPVSIGITFGSGSDNLPTLTLPYATYSAYSYDVDDDVSTTEDPIPLTNNCCSITRSRTYGSQRRQWVTCGGQSLRIRQRNLAYRMGPWETNVHKPCQRT